MFPVFVTASLVNVTRTERQKITLEKC